MHLQPLTCPKRQQSAFGTLSADSHHTAQCFLPKMPQSRHARGLMKQVTSIDSAKCLGLIYIFLCLQQSAFISEKFTIMSCFPNPFHKV